jgi:hypothetical protein
MDGVFGNPQWDVLDDVIGRKAAPDLKLDTIKIPA